MADGRLELLEIRVKKFFLGCLGCSFCYGWESRLLDIWGEVSQGLTDEERGRLANMARERFDRLDAALRGVNAGLSAVQN